MHDHWRVQPGGFHRGPGRRRSHRNVGDARWPSPPRRGFLCPNVGRRPIRPARAVPAPTASSELRLPLHGVRPASHPMWPVLLQPRFAGLGVATDIYSRGSEARL